MNKLIPLLLLAGLVGAPFVASAEETKPSEKKEAPAKKGKFKWYTSMKQARKAAAEEKKPIFALFTGSDWCPYCVKLEKEILSKKEFKDWATDNVILFIADSKGGPGNLKAEDGKLMKEYGGKGFPTVIITDAEGKKTGQTGYHKVSPAEYVKQLDGLIGAKK
jgi:thioredoxin-related protein